MTVFVYVNTSKQVGDADHIKVFTNVDAAGMHMARDFARARLPFRKLLLLLALCLASAIRTR
jgi:hypothetical protein